MDSIVLFIVIGLILLVFLCIFWYLTLDFRAYCKYYVFRKFLLHCFSKGIIFKNIDYSHIDFISADTEDNIKFDNNKL